MAGEMQILALPLPARPVQQTKIVKAVRRCATLASQEFARRCLANARAACKNSTLSRPDVEVLATILLSEKQRWQLVELMGSQGANQLIFAFNKTPAGFVWACAVTVIFRLRLDKVQMRLHLPIPSQAEACYQDAWR